MTSRVTGQRLGRGHPRLMNVQRGVGRRPAPPIARREPPRQRLPAPGRESPLCVPRRKKIGFVGSFVPPFHGSKLPRSRIKKRAHPIAGTNAKSVVPPELGRRLTKNPRGVAGKRSQPHSFRVRPQRGLYPGPVTGASRRRLLHLPVYHSLIRLVSVEGFALQLRGPFGAVVSGRTFTTGCLLSEPSSCAYSSSSRFFTVLGVIICPRRDLSRQILPDDCKSMPILARSVALLSIRCYNYFYD